MSSCTHDVTDSTEGVCIRCLADDLQVSAATARTIAARICDPCACSIPHEDICWNCTLEDTPHDPACPAPLVRSDLCAIHDFGALTSDEFRALPDWPGRARSRDAAAPPPAVADRPPQDG